MFFSKLAAESPAPPWKKPLQAKGRDAWFSLKGFMGGESPLNGFDGFDGG
jgi:hypothetical protein